MTRIKSSFFFSLIALISSLFAQQQWSIDQQHQGAQPSFQPMDGNQRGFVNSVLSPQQLRPNYQNGVSGGGGVQIQFQLRGYSNPSLQLPAGNTCICPPGQSCSYLSRRDSAECFFAFTFIISAPDQSVRYFATPFITLDSNGNLDRAGERWDENYVVQLPSKPSAIDVFVHHLGSVIRSSDGSLVNTMTLTHVDTFVVPLDDDLPTAGRLASVPSPRTFTGTMLQTQLSLSVSIGCLGDMIGAQCDLTCASSPVSTQKMSCRQNSTGFFFICNRAAMTGQVDECQSCPWGVREGSYCQDENGKVMNPANAGVVDGSWKVAAIILAISTLVFFVLFFVCAIFGCRGCRQGSDDEKLPGHNLPGFERAVQRHEGQALRPLLEADHGSPVSTPGSGPVAAPRNQPNLGAIPPKSALRKPPLVPPAHLGGSNSVNDTLNSSFAGDVPMRPSRSEIV
ncbi:unnamed protein product, partial [Mesorhabditis belari]|uniref:Uncharacterized protein n=1 Tax=Mesorhabditis belari TaxID=2138241 RepID=A0AAF3J9Q6_9BILA